MNSASQVWLSDEEVQALDAGLRGMPRALGYACGAFWLVYRVAEIQGSCLGRARCKLWQLYTMSFVHALCAVYAGYLFHILMGDRQRTAGRVFAYSEGHMALIPWTLGFLGVEYFMTKSPVEGMAEPERITRLFRASIGASLILLQQVYPCVLGMHWLHWTQLCEARNLFTCAAWLLALKAFPRSLLNLVHYARRAITFGSLVGTVAAAVWAAQYARQHELWAVTDIPEDKKMFTYVYLAAFGTAAVLNVFSVWREYTELTLMEGPLELTPLTEEELAKEGIKPVKPVVGGPMVAGKDSAEGKATAATRRGKKGHQKTKA